MDISTWRLPPYVDQAFHRTELGHDGLANTPAARVGQVASVQVQFHEEATVPDMAGVPWGILEGRIEELRADGRVALTGTLTSDGPRCLDRRWQLVLRFHVDDPHGDPWYVDDMRADGVVTLPRRWPRMAIASLRRSNDLACSDEQETELAQALFAAALPHAHARDLPSWLGAALPAMEDVLRRAGLDPALSIALAARIRSTGW